MPKISGVRTFIVDRKLKGLRAISGSVGVRDRKVRPGLAIDWNRHEFGADAHRGSTQNTEET